MAYIRNTAAMQLKGKVGNTTYYVESGRQLARVSQNSSNYGETARRSEAQQFQRGKWGNLVNFYKASKSWMRKAYETKKRTQSDYNRFMQLNTQDARIYLTKNMYANGGCVVDMFRISEGSLRSIQTNKVGDLYKTDLRVGSLTIDADTTIADLTQALLLNNNQLRDNMQISFISYQQDVDTYGTPYIICTAYELTLDSIGGQKVRAYLPEFCSSVVDGCLGTNNRISTGAFAYVLSETLNGVTRVSTQSLITKNDGLINQYSSLSAQRESIDSYGVDEDIFLTSGSVPTDPTPQPIYLQRIGVVGGDLDYSYSVGGKGPEVGAIWSQGGNEYIDISGSFGNATKVTLIFFGPDNSVDVPILSRSGNRLYLGTVPSTWYDFQIQTIVVTIDGEQIEGTFRPYD